MPQQPFTLSTYPHAVPLFASGRRLVNYYAERAEGQARDQYLLVGCPGMKQFSDTGAAGSPCRGFVWWNSVLYAVVGATLFSITSAGTASSIGGISGSNPVSFAGDNNELLIITDGDDYIFDGTTLSQYTGDNIVDFSDAEFLDGRAVLPQASPSIAGRFSWTDVNALSTVSSDSFANAESSPDPLYRVLKVGRLLWMLGESTVEPWYSTADTPAFARHGDIVKEIGIGALYSRASLPASEGSPDRGFFLGLSKKSKPSVYVIEGAAVRRISTNALDRILGANTYSDAVGFTYSQDGHDFYCLVLPTAKRTFVYDATLGFWHERQSGVQEVAAWDARHAIVAHDKVLVGHKSDGKIYELDFATHTDAGSKRLAMFTAELASSGETWNRLDSVLVQLDVGVGTAGATVEPQIMMAISTDGGQTFGDEDWRGIGFSADWGRIAKWDGLGPFQQALLKFKITDAVKRNIVKVFARGAQGRPVG